MVIKNSLVTIFLAAGFLYVAWVWLRIVRPRFCQLVSKRTDTVHGTLSTRLSAPTYHKHSRPFLRSFEWSGYLSKSLGFWDVLWWLMPKIKPANATSQIFVRGAVARTVVLTFTDLRTVTVKDVTDLLATRRLINPSHIERYSVGYGGSHRTARLLPAVKLFDVGVRPGSSLVLSWTVRGFGRSKSSYATRSATKTIAGTASSSGQNSPVYAPPSAEPSVSTDSMFTVPSRKHTRTDGLEDDFNAPIPKKPRKNPPRNLKAGELPRKNRMKATPDSDYDSSAELVERPQVVKKKERKGNRSGCAVGNSSGDRPPRVHDKNLSNKRDLHLWALQEDVSYEALRTLHELCSMPRYDGNGSKLVLTSPGQDQYSLSYGPIQTTCCHDEKPPADILSYGRCCVLEFMGMYWSPLLQCVVQTEKHEILVWDELQTEISHQYAERCSSLALSQEWLFSHITRSFGIKKETPEELYSRLHSIVARHPIPGLDVPSLLYRPCPNCHRWYDRARNSKGKVLHACSSILGSQHVMTDFSVALLPSQRVDLRIRIQVPQHKELIKQQSAMSSSAKTVIKVSPGHLSADSQLVKTWMDSTFRNVTGPKASKLNYTAASNTYEFVAHGHTFRCIHNEQPPLAHETLYTGCAVLSFFQLFACPVLKAVVNPLKKRLLCSESLIRVFKSRRHGQPNDTLLAHVNHVFKLLDEPEHVSLKLDQPLLGLPAPQKVFVCQAPDCQGAFAPVTASKRHHYSWSPQCSDYPLIKTYAITLWPNGSKSKHFRALMTENWINNLPQLVRTAVHSYDVPPHFEDSGFLAHLEEWKIGRSSCILSAISQLPSQTNSSWSKWSEGSLSSKLDQCIIKLHCLLGHYLTESEVRLENSSPVIRRAVAMLNQNIDTASIKFGLILPSTISNYRSFISKMFIIILRFCIVRHGVKDKDHPEDRNRCLKLQKELCKVALRLTPTQKQLIEDFVLMVRNASGKHLNQIIFDFIHRFLVDLFGWTYSPKRKVDCVLEQVVLVLSLIPDGKWRSAKCALSIFSAIFRTSRAVFVNAAFMGGMEIGYKSLAEEHEAEEEEPEAEEEEEEPEAGEEEVNEEEIEEIQTAETDFDLGREIATAGKEEKGILQFFKKHSAFIDINNHSSLCGRLNVLRTRAVQVATGEPHAARYIWSEDFGTLVFTWAFIQETKINIADLRLQIFQNAQEELLKTFEQLFPPDFLAENVDAFSLSSCRSFVDHAHCNSIFTIPENAEVFRPLIKKLTVMTSDRLEMNQDSMRSLLDRTSAFLKAFLSALFMTVGVPPHSWQAAQLCYADTAQSERNLMLVNGRQLIFTNTKAGIQSNTKDGSLWLLPPQLSHVLLFYLGVMRPVEIALGVAGKYKLSETVKDAMQSFVFCYPLRQKSPVWSADNVDEILKERGLKMEAYAHRLVFSEIIRTKHKAFLAGIDRPSVLDAQAQHTRTTGQRNYAVIKLQHTTGVQSSEHERQLLLCQALHASCFLAKPLLTSFADKPTAMWDIILSHENYGLLIARQLVDSEYYLSIFSSDQVAIISRMLYRTAPFFFDDNKKPPEKPIFCDKQLRKLVIELYKGPQGVATRSLAELDHDEIESLTASAATLMLAAIAEWFSGQIVPYQGVVSLAVNSWRCLFASFKHDIGTIQSKHPKLWEGYVSWLQTEEQSFTGSEVGGKEEKDLPLPCF